MTTWDSHTDGRSWRSCTGTIYLARSWLCWCICLPKVSGPLIFSDPDVNYALVDWASNAVLGRHGLKKGAAPDWMAFNNLSDNVLKTLVFFFCSALSHKRDSCRVETHLWIQSINARCVECCWLQKKECFSFRWSSSIRFIRCPCENKECLHVKDLHACSCTLMR